MSVAARDNRRIPDDFEEDPRYRVSVREARIVIAYWVVFTVVVTAIAWGLGGNRSADEITFVRSANGEVRECILIGDGRPASAPGHPRCSRPGVCHGRPGTLRCQSPVGLTPAS